MGFITTFGCIREWWMVRFSWQATNPDLVKAVRELANSEWQGGKPAPEQSLELVSHLETEISWSRTAVLES